MDLGSRIKKIRKDNKLTQDDFAEKYNVTRQTISSWENSKSYPDIETLVKISDDFSISLDKLLKEDKNMIKKITKSQKDNIIYKKILVMLSIIIGVIIILYFALPFCSELKIKHQLETTINNYKFVKTSDGTYKYDYKDNITYEIPNPENLRPSKYNFRFFEKTLYCNINLDGTYLKLTWIDNNYFDADIIEKQTNKKIDNIGLLGNKSIDQISEITKRIDIDKDLLKEVINKGNEIYGKTY